MAALMHSSRIEKSASLSGTWTATMKCNQTNDSVGCTTENQWACNQCVKPPGGMDKTVVSCAINDCTLWQYQWVNNGDSECGQLVDTVFLVIVALQACKQWRTLLQHVQPIGFTLRCRSHSAHLFTSTTTPASATSTESSAGLTWTKSKTFSRTAPVHR